jgi:hypothetical protein
VDLGHLAEGRNQWRAVVTCYRTSGFSKDWRVFVADKLLAYEEGRVAQGLHRSYSDCLKEKRQKLQNAATIAQ